MNHVLHPDLLASSDHRLDDYIYDDLIPDSNRTKSCCKYNIVNRRNTILEPIEEIHSETTSTQPNAQEFTVFYHLNFVKDYVIEFWSWLFSYKI